MLDVIANRLAPHGLIVRGAFHPDPADDVPVLASGTSVGTVVLVGNAGSAMWRSFSREPRPMERHPLNEWIELVMGVLVQDLGAEVCYPHHGPPFRPFLHWAQRAEPIARSPLGLFIHPRFGLWHAYRAALLFSERLPVPLREPVAAPCEGCAAKPCLTACPLAHLRGVVLHVVECATSDAGRTCREQGCAARRACPIGVSYRYEPAHARFHMEAFLRGPAEQSI